MRGWLVAAVLGAGWVATSVEAARRYREDGKALVAARAGLDAGYDAARGRDGFSAVPAAQTQRIVTAAVLVGAALEARS